MSGADLMERLVVTVCGPIRLFYLPENKMGPDAKRSLRTLHDFVASIRSLSNMLIVSLIRER
eukprot:scaffold314796_cov38-Prasinocladus_malaysianus.AAC.2